ncbi:AMP-dependent synthetase/ligase [Amycolatopsis orientalis]|uniref:AMP-dependent synthetase/ligase n=1 Tax=Amycolatopsis orientalis TaxID=31958 RepID=UPI0003FD18C0|nr:long-chain fatty acid--CoA ligase [Amycolatopsis orientalis]
MSETPLTMCAAFQRTAARDPGAVALRTPDDAVTITWRDYAERVRSIAAGLAALGVGAGDTVALMLTNRPEFHLVDTAVLHLGAVPFSVYNTSPPELIKYVFGNAGNRVVITEQLFLAPLREALALGAAVEHVICVDGGPEATVSLAAVEAAPAAGFDFDATWRAVRPDDLLTLIYTSGTTGPPKGVELTHHNIMFDMLAVDEVLIRSRPGDRGISYLPDAHIANRWIAHYSNIVFGMQVTDVPTPKQVVQALTDVRPTGFLGVPQTWYKIKAALELALAQEPNPVKRRLASRAIDIGRQVARRRSDGRRIPAGLALRHALAERLVLAKIRRRIGMDQLRMAATGAAPIAPEVHEFLLGLGLKLCECWGMSELAAGVTITRPGAIRIGTVGQAIRGVEVKVAEDGELLVRGPIVMKGYRNQPDKTAETIDADGWLHTGDIGTIDADGHVRIVERKKELIINASGKNMSPSNIEAAIRAQCPLVGYAIAIGDDRPYVTALLTLDPDIATAYATEHDLPDTSPAALAADPRLRAEVANGIAAANKLLSKVEEIREFTILPHRWEPGGDLLTPTMKLKRKPIAERYTDEITAMYDAGLHRGS